MFSDMVSRSRACIQHETCKSYLVMRKYYTKGRNDPPPESPRFDDKHRKMSSVVGGNKRGLVNAVRSTLLLQAKVLR